MANALGLPTDWKELTTHGAAHIAPLMSEDEFKKLCESMKTHGYFDTHPIILHEGRIIDGRNRFEAAIQTDTKPAFKLLPKGTDPYWYAWYVNVEGRRMLTHAQRATAAARMAEALQEDRKAQALAAGYTSVQARTRHEAHVRARTAPTDSTGKAGAVPPLPPKVRKGASVAEASDKTGISVDAVERTLQVKREAPDLFEQMEKGAITVGAASDALKARKSPVAIAQEHGKQNADAIADAQTTPLEDHVVRERWLNIKSQVARLKSFGMASSVHNCKLTLDELDDIITFLCDVREAQDTGKVVIDVVAK